MQETQFKEERIIISLNPDFNPTGNKHPNTIKKEMKSDPDFLELSEDEQKALFKKVDSLISTMDDIKKYGTLSEMVEEASHWNCSGVPYGKDLILDNFNKKLCYTEDEYVALHGGWDRIWSGGIHVPLHLGERDFIYKDGVVLNAGEKIMSVGVSHTRLLADPRYVPIWDIVMPFTGRIFALTDIKDPEMNCDSSKKDMHKQWNEDIFIIAGRNETRKEVIAWYKKSTGKIPSYKSADELKEEKQASANKVNKFASKWGI